MLAQAMARPVSMHFCTERLQGRPHPMLTLTSLGFRVQGLGGQGRRTLWPLEQAL